MCGIGGGCSSPNDQDVLLNFPLAGFQIGEIHPLTQQQRVPRKSYFCRVIRLKRF